MSMVSNAQLRANRVNAKRAGIKTEVGKEVSKYNAVRHGVLCRTLISTEQTEAQAMHDHFVEEYRPQSMTEYLLIESMVLAYIRSQRAIQAEKSFLAKGMIAGTVIRFNEEDTTSNLEFIIAGNAEFDVLGKTYLRYITACERQFYRALHELQRVQELRKGKRLSSFAVDIMNDREDD